MVTLPPVPVLVVVLVVWLCTGGIMCSKPLASTAVLGARGAPWPRRARRPA